MAVGDIYKVVLKSRGQSVERVNVFHFQLASESGTPSVLAAQSASYVVTANILPGIQAIVTNGTEFYEANSVCYANPSDYFNITFSASGTRGTSSMPSFVAWSYRSSLPSPGLRRGFKRFGDVAEIDANGNNAESSRLVELNALAAALGQNQVRDGRTFIPVIARGSKTLGTNPQFSIASNWQLRSPNIGSQTSRKFRP